MLYILLSGELAVFTQEGLRVATIKPVTTVGEMGVMSGQPRSATVEATQASQLFALAKHRVETLLRDDREIQVKVYKNIINVLATKVMQDNIRMRDYEVERERYKHRINVLERQSEQITPCQ